MLREQIKLMNMQVLETLQNLSDSEYLDLKLKEIKAKDKNIDLVIEINKEKVYVEEKYEVIKIQPVDMFPHTQHIESVALLILKS